MATVRFNVIIGEDRLIRVPENILPGAAEVIVQQTNAVPNDENPRLRAMINRLAQAAQNEGIQGLPTDLAENHDHYAQRRETGTDILNKLAFVRCFAKKNEPTAWNHVTE